MQINLANASREELVNYATIIGFENTQLRARVAWFERQVFGVKSERLIPQDVRQITLFEVSEEPPAPGTTVASYERSARKKPTDTETEAPKLRFDASVPVDEEVVYPPEVLGLAEDAYEVIGEKVTERLAQIPVQYRVKRTIRKTVKIKETATLHTAPAPAAIIDRSFADVSFLAGLITDKFQYHLPLYRQHQRMEARGVHITRSYLTKLVHRTLELLEPVYYSLLSTVTTREMVSMDETPIKASRQEAGKMKTAYFWPVFAENQVAFVYASTREKKVVAEVLGKGCKKLLSDGYRAYQSYAESRSDLIHAQCWAHVRRKFFDAKEHAPPECTQVLEYIAALFATERELQGKDDTEILACRRERSSPLVDEFFIYLDTLWFDKMTDKVSLLGKAIAYARDREQGLRQFLTHADIALSNNHVERAIRPVALGRKNWLFCWSEVGAKYAAIAYSLIESAKLADVDPWTYLVDILQRIDSHPARDVHLLTPTLWKEQFQAQVNNAA